MLKNIIGKNLKNAFWIIGEQIFQMLVSLIVGVLSARYLGPNNYGSLNYTASFVAFFSSIASLGMESVVIKKMIARPDLEGSYLGGCMLLRLCSSILSAIAVCLLVVLLNPGDTLKLALVAVQSMHLMFKAVHILDAWFQKHLKSKYVSIGKAVACVLVSAYKIFLLATQKSIVWFAASSTLSDLLISIMLLVFYHREKSGEIRFDAICGYEVLQESYHYIISGIMVAIYGHMDRIMIGQMMTDYDVGLYTTAAAIAGMWVFVPTAIINSFRPMIMEKKVSQNQTAFLLSLKQLYSAIIWLCIFVSIVVALFGKYIIWILYGKAYLAAADTLRIIIWLETFSMIGTARGIWIVSENKGQYVKYYLGIGVLVNLVLNNLLIPAMGINGAAFATLATQITTSIIAPLLFKETRVHTQIVMEAFLVTWFWKKDNQHGSIEK